MLPMHQDTLLQWSEPWFFKLRTSGRTAWILRGIAILSIWGLFFTLLGLEPKTGEKPPFAFQLLFPLFIGVFFVALFELPMSQRIAAIAKNEIHCGPNPIFAVFASPIFMLLQLGQWGRRELKEVQILRPDEPGNPTRYAVMVVYPKHSGCKMVGIPDTVAPENVAEAIQKVGIPVQLSGWTSATPANELAPT